MTDLALSQARELAAAFFESMRRQDLALMVRAGAGDDFPEVATAAALLSDLSERAVHQEEALRAYADREFWDDDLPGGSLALHDRGQMARNVLAGKSPFYNCE